MLRAAFIILVLFVILSASEISHDQSVKAYTPHFFGEILHCYYAALNAFAEKIFKLFRLYA